MRLDIIVGLLGIIGGFIFVFVCAYLYRGIWIVLAVLIWTGIGFLALARLKFLDKRRDGES